MIRRGLLALLAILFVWLVVARRAELAELGHVLVLGLWPWVLLALLLLAASYLAYAELFRASFAAVGVASRLGGTLVVLMASLVVNVMVPSAGAAGLALFVDDAARRG